MADAPDSTKDIVDGVEASADALPARTLTDADAQAIAEALFQGALQALGRVLRTLGDRLAGAANGT